MRPRSSTMLQQNNNNNYPCLNMSGSSRLELGLGDLPLIRGLRAWALCSKNRRSLLGKSQVPTARPVECGASTSCSRPGDVHLSEEWGRMGYGLPLEARQTGIGALVTVATLKTSEGGGKTQTRCLFVRTEKGSCLYPSAANCSAYSMVGDWLRGGAGGSVTGRRDSAPPAQTNQVRVRSGRRWRKSGSAATRQPRNREKQEEQDKGGPDRKQLDNRSSTCCRDVPPKAFTQCEERPQRTESQDQGESPGSGDQKNEEEGDVCVSDLTAPSTGLEHHRNSHNCRNDEEMRGAKCNKGQRMQISCNQDDGAFREEETNAGLLEKHGGDVMATGDVPSSVNTNISRGEADVSEGGTENGAESSCPAGGDVCTAAHQNSCALTAHESKLKHIEFPHLKQEGVEEKDFGFMSEDELNDCKFQSNFAANQSETEEFQNEKTQVLSASSCSEWDWGNWRGEGRTCNKSPAAECGLSQQHPIIEIKKNYADECMEGRANPETGCTDPSCHAALSNPAPALPLLASMATDLPCLKAEESGVCEEEKTDGELEERGSNQEEEDEFGVFVQAEPAWSGGVQMSESGESLADRNWSITCSPGWNDVSAHQPDDEWTAFPVGGAGEEAKQWWPSDAAEARRERPSTNHNLLQVFAEAFPSLPTSSRSDLDAVPTLTQLLQDRTEQDEGLLDSFHDLNKMIGQSYKKANGVSRGLLLKTLNLEPVHVEIRPSSWTTNHRLSPGLSSANQHAQIAKRRLSYDYNRNILQ